MIHLFTSVYNNNKLIDEISCATIYKLILSTPHYFCSIVCTSVILLFEQLHLQIRDTESFFLLETPLYISISLSDISK